MKKIMTIAVAVCLTMAVSAQRGHGIGGTRVVVVSPGFGYSPFYYSPFGYSPFGYAPFGYPYGYNNGYRSSSKLQMKVEDIKADYADKIKSARRDKSLDRADRKKIIRQLKSDRDKAVHDAKANYYKPVQPAPAASVTGS